MTVVDVNLFGDHLGPTGTEVADLVTSFVGDVPSAQAVLVVDVHGLPLAWTGSLPEESVDHLAAVVMGLHALGATAAATVVADRCDRHYLELGRQAMLVERVNERALLAVVVDRRGDIGAVSYETTLLAGRLERLLGRAVVDALAGRPGGR